MPLKKALPLLFIFSILLVSVMGCVTTNYTNSTNTNSAKNLSATVATVTTKAITSPTVTQTPMAAPTHDVVLSKYIDLYRIQHGIMGTTVTAWQTTWLNSNSVKLQKSTITSITGMNLKTSLTETDVITRFASTSEASNYVQSLLGTAAYRKTIDTTTYPECAAYKQLTGQEPTLCANYDTGVSAPYGPGKAITQANEIVITSDYVSAAA